MLPVRTSDSSAMISIRTAFARNNDDIKPIADERIGWIDVSFETKYGKIRSAWSWVDGKIRYEISVPTDAVIRVNGSEYEVKKGEYIF